MTQEEQNLEKKYHFINMTTEEYFYIMRKAGLSQTQLGKNAKEILSRNKPYSPSTINRWFDYQNYMTGKQIYLLKESLPEGYFEAYREMYIDQVKH